MKNMAPWIKVLLSSAVALITTVALTAYGNAHMDNEPVYHLFSHLAQMAGTAILIFSSRRYWTPPKTKAEMWPRRILLAGLYVGLFAGTLGGLTTLPNILDHQLKENQLLSPIHGFDQPFLLFGFVFTLLGVALTLLFRIFFWIRPNKSKV